MLVSELVRATSVPLATVKYYLREGLLPAGRKSSARTADYDDRHVRRLTLLRILRDVGALPVARLRDLVEAVEDETLSVHGMFARATDALAPPTPPAGPRQDEAQTLVADLLAGMGWSDVRPEAVDRANLTAVLEKLISTDLFHVDARVLRFYADHADAIARAEIAGLDEKAGRAGLLEQMVVGTVVFGEVLTILRRLAEEHHSRERFGDVH